MAIIVKNYVVDTYEDDLEMGEIGNTCACWSNSAVPVSGTFNTAREALDAIAEANYWTADKLKWNDRSEYGCPIGTYETSIEVDADNAEADAADIEAWKRGEGKLWIANVYAELAWRDERALTEAEAAI